MERWTKPVALITTVNPYALVWLLAISFFLTLTAVAILSRGRNWREVLVMFLLGFLALSAASIVSTNYVADIQVVAVEVVKVTSD